MKWSWFGLEKGYWIWGYRNLDEWTCVDCGGLVLVVVMMPFMSLLWLQVDIMKNLSPFWVSLGFYDCCLRFIFVILLIILLDAYVLCLSSHASVLKTCSNTSECWILYCQWYNFLHFLFEGFDMLESVLPVVQEE